MRFPTILFVGILVSCVFIVQGGEKMKDSTPPCNYPAMYNFGDSNSDTGGLPAAFFPMPPPYGETYFRKPAGRFSDGRLIIDFIADHLGLPYLSPYLDSIGSSYRHGANFAIGGATMMRPNISWIQNGTSPFPLDTQVVQFTQFKERTTFLYHNQDKNKEYGCSKRLPRPEDFSKALFTIDMGQNDIAAAIRNNITTTEFHQITPKIITLFKAQIHELYKKGARTFWIHNTGPIGCLPLTTVKVKDPPPGYLDQYGCVKSHNDMARNFNKHLKSEIVKLRAEFPAAAIIYVDIYRAKYELISNAENQGFEDPFKICCGYHEIEFPIWCGNIGEMNGTQVFAGSCANPSRVVSWDGGHYTEAANRWIFKRIINGSLSDPPINITRACHHKKMGNV